MVEFEMLQFGFATIVNNGYMSLELLMDSLHVNKKMAKLIVKEMVQKELIDKFVFSKKIMLLISNQDFKKMVFKMPKEVQERIREDFCIYNEKISLTTLEVVNPLEISEDLINKARLLKDVYGTLTTLILQKELKIGYSKAIRLLDVIEK